MPERSHRTGRTPPLRTVAGLEAAGGRPAGRGMAARRAAGGGLAVYLSVGKGRHRGDEENEETGDSTSTGSSADGSSDGSSASNDEDEGPVRRRPPERAEHSGLDWKIELGIVLAIVVVAALGYYVYTKQGGSTSGSSSSISSSLEEKTAAAPSTSEGGATATKTTDTATGATATAASSSAGVNDKTALSSFSSSSSADDPSPSSDSSSSSSDGTPAANAPAEFSAVTLTGSWADTAAYTIATGTFADVPGESSTVALDGLTTSADPAEATKGVIYVGDSTWYAAGSGGYGSCGQPLYDGQKPYFAAMSLYHWMGSPGPSTHCWECVTLQSVSDPSKIITAIVADSCEACEFAHIDLEQAAYYELGGTVNSGVVTVAWEFVDCPDDYSEDAIKALDSSAYTEVDTS